MVPLDVVRPLFSDTYLVNCGGASGIACRIGKVVVIQICNTPNALP